MENKNYSNFKPMSLIIIFLKKTTDTVIDSLAVTSIEKFNSRNEHSVEK